MREIALHLLDIAENSVAAGASFIQIFVIEDLLNDLLKAAIRDDGKGMDAATISQVTDPFFTSRTTRKVGLGIPLLKAAAEACLGSLIISSELGKGTIVEVEFQHSHIDRMPVGDLAGTILTLVVAYPHIHWQFTYDFNPPEPQASRIRFFFDDGPVKAELGDLPLTEPEILAYLRETLEQGIAMIQKPLLANGSYLGI
jgi:hypothetical protein